VLTKRTKHYEKLFSLLGERPGTFMIKSKLSAADTKVKDELLEKLRTGSTDFNVILGTFSLLSTGINIPALDTIVLAGDLKSSVLTTQAVGRCLRVMLNKPNVRIIDIVDSNNRMFYRQYLERKKFYSSQGWL
jgi:superfamily II DNA or RNA helicase